MIFMSTAAKNASARFSVYRKTGSKLRLEGIRTIDQPIIVVRHIVG